MCQYSGAEEQARLTKDDELQRCFSDRRQPQSYPNMTTAVTAPQPLPASKNTAGLRQSSSAAAVDKAQESQEEVNGR